MTKQLTIEHILKHVARFHTRDNRVSDAQWRAVWYARLVYATLQRGTWRLTPAGVDLLTAFNAETADTEDGTEGCPGHESLDGAHMGQSVYCDGSCQN